VRIQKLTLEHFRNYPEATFAFTKDISIVEGHNAIGKSNFIEALSLLSLTKSHKASLEEFVIEYQQPHARVAALFTTQDRQQEIVCVIEKIEGRTKKTWRIQKAPMTPAKVVGQFSVVTFSPDDLDALARSSSARRAYLDQILIKSNRQAHATLQRLKKTLQQRSAALELARLGQSTDLESFNAQLVTLGAEVSFMRYTLIQEIAPLFSDVYRRISKTNTVELALTNSLFSIPENATQKWFEETYQKHIEELREREIQAARNLVGPQRDDVTLELDKRDLTEFGSRGEWRTAVIALKMCELTYLERKRGERPILLLDDVFSELDRERQQALLQCATQQQTIITTTDAGEFDRESLPSTELIKILDIKAGSKKVHEAYS
jgi:DNA replication and repair protein RecF